MLIINKIKKHYFLLLSTFLFFYIIFNLLDGQRGLISYFEKKNIYTYLLEKKEKKTLEINNLEHKILLLSDKADLINLDFLEILLRKNFFYGLKNEKVYLIEKNEN